MVLSRRVCMRLYLDVAVPIYAFKKFGIKFDAYKARWLISRVSGSTMTKNLPLQLLAMPISSSILLCNKWVQNKKEILG